MTRQVALMFTALVVLAMSMVLPGAAHAGRNRNGALVVHTNDDVVYTHTADYCGTHYDDPGSCAQAVTRTDKSPGDAAVIWFLAAFPELASPAVTVVYFGITHDLDPGAFTDWDFCGPAGSIQIPDDGWPETGFGNSVAFGAPVAGRLLFPVYWFAALGSEGRFLATAVNPVGGYAAFVDDSSPPQLDWIERFGTARWNAGGANHCPDDILLGACCMPSGSCFVTDAVTCADTMGVFQGVGVPCEPNPCPAPLGACCLWDGHCERFNVDDCARYQGFWQGGETVCDPNPCDQPLEACCYPNQTCWLYPPDHCRNTGGTPQGYGTTCETVACRAPALGACCLDDGSCEVLLEAQCQALGGAFYDAVPCNPSPCLTPTEITSWGRIRAAYR